MGGDERAREAGALRKICSLKISICKCDTADVPSTALHGLAKLGPARLGLRSDLGFAFRALFTFAPPSRRRGGNACGVSPPAFY